MDRDNIGQSSPERNGNDNMRNALHAELFTNWLYFLDFLFGSKKPGRIFSLVLRSIESSRIAGCRRPRGRRRAARMIMGEGSARQRALLGFDAPLMPSYLRCLVVREDCAI